MKMWKLLVVKLLKVLLLVLVFVVFTVDLSVRSLAHFKDRFKPYETTQKIWVPEEYSIVNQVDGRYTPIQSVFLSGTAVYVPFQIFKERFASKNIDVIIQTDGLVYYIVEQTGKKFFAKAHYAPYVRLRSHRCEIMISDLAVKNFYGQDSNSLLMNSLISSIFWMIVAGIFCFLIYHLLAWGKRRLMK